MWPFGYTLFLTLPSEKIPALRMFKCPEGGGEISGDERAATAERRPKDRANLPRFGGQRVHVESVSLGWILLVEG